MARNIGSSSSSSNSEEEGGGILLERPIFRPRKKLLVISLGGLLCARVCRRDTSNIPQSRPPDAAYGSILGREGGLWIYLDGLAKADDVHTYVKNHPFGQPAITAMRPDWDYYSKIVHRQSKE